jgi:mannose-1-phosphate guanylyltransferase
VSAPPLRAIVLCAGLGTRLRPITDRWPKPAVPLLGQPLFRYTLAMLKRAGVTAVGINTHWLPEVMRATARSECARLGIDLAAVHEPEIQGTGGGIRGLRAFADRGGGPFLVVNGDILFSAELGPLVEAHRASGAVATMVLMPMPLGERYAAVETDASGSVRRIAGAGPGGEGLTPWHFTGVHVMSPQVFEAMRDTGVEDINREVYVRLLEGGKRVRGEVIDPAQAYWSDLGTPPRLAATHRDLLHGQVPLQPFEGSSPFDGAVELGPGIWANPTARLQSPKIDGPALFGPGCDVGANVILSGGVAIGAGARVGAGAQLKRVVLLDGAVVNAGEQLEGCLVFQGTGVPSRVLISAEAS